MKIQLLICLMMIIAASAVRAQTGCITGRVTPVGCGAFVYAENTAGTDYGDDYIDATTGDYVISSLNDGTYVIAVQAENYATESATVTISNGLSVTKDFTLTESGAIAGLITPIGAKATVVAVSSTGERYTVALNQDGSFRVIKLKPGNYTLSVEPEPKYLVPPVKTNIQVTAGNVSRGYQFRLELGGSITGSITPVSNAAMILAFPENNMITGKVAEYDPATGNFIIVGLNTGYYNLGLIAKGYKRIIGIDTGVSNSTLSESEVIDVSAVIGNWFNAHQQKSVTGVLNLLTDSYVDTGANLDKEGFGQFLIGHFAGLQSLSANYSLDVVRGVSGSSAVVIYQTQTTYTPTIGDPFTNRHQGKLTLVKESGVWKITSGIGWDLNYIYDPFENESTPVIVRYKHDSSISHINVTKGQTTQVQPYTLEPAQ